MSLFYSSSYKKPFVILTLLNPLIKIIGIISIETRWSNYNIRVGDYEGLLPFRKSVILCITLREEHFREYLYYSHCSIRFSLTVYNKCENNNLLPLLLLKLLTNKKIISILEVTKIFHYL